MAAQNVFRGVELAILVMSGSHLVLTLASQGAFLEQSKGNHISKEAFYDGVRNAAGSTLGCGAPLQGSQMIKFKNDLMPMWLALPKTNDKIDRRSLRHLVHRYFMRSSSIMIRGFEPARSFNDSHWGVADILSEKVPAYVESVLQSKHALQVGFSIEDVVNVVATLDRLIFDSQASLLDIVFHDQKRRADQLMDLKSLVQVLEEYMIHWLVDADEEEIRLIVTNRSLAEEIIPDFTQLVGFLEGMARSLHFQRQLRPRETQSWNAWESRFSFADAHEVVGGLTRSFHHYWYSECSSMKKSLIAMDTHLIGRVPLAKFYGTGADLDWRFGESETYLRELGALDETSKWRGKQVIIPNYLQGISNCFVNAQYYRICCPNHCETHLDEIERALEKSAAVPSTILGVVRNISVMSDDDDTVNVDESLVVQLDRIASTHSGSVPIHGRLFAQWLHYVFPHDCPFPHKAGKVSLAAPTEFGEFGASEEEMRMHAATINETSINVSMSKEELQWMSQWSSDEELLMDDAQSFSATWGQPVLLLGLGTFICIAGVAAESMSSSKPQIASKRAANSHWV